MRAPVVRSWLNVVLLCGLDIEPVRMIDYNKIIL